MVSPNSRTTCATVYARLYAALSDEAVFAAINPAGALVEHVLWDEAARDDIAVLVAAIG